MPLSRNAASTCLPQPYPFYTITCCAIQPSNAGRRSALGGRHAPARRAPPAGHSQWCSLCGGGALSGVVAANGAWRGRRKTVVVSRRRAGVRATREYALARASGEKLAYIGGASGYLRIYLLRAQPLSSLRRAGASGTGRHCGRPALHSWQNTNMALSCFTPLIAVPHRAAKLWLTFLTASVRMFGRDMDADRRGR